MSKKSYSIALVGATGLVGKTFLEAFLDLAIPIKNLKLFASPSSKGKTIIFNQHEYIVDTLSSHSFDDIDIAFFSAGRKVSKKYIPSLLKKKIYIIDNSSYYRLKKNVPLIIPEVNFDTFQKENYLIANPNCSTAQCVLPLKVLKDTYGITSINYTTYQSVSGSGYKGIQDLLRTQKNIEPLYYPYNIYNTCIPEIDEYDRDNYTKEERKMILETKKILNDDKIKISATCVRVPILQGHSISIAVQLKKKFLIKDLQDLMNHTKGIILKDDLKNHIYPLVTDALHQDDVIVGRFRKDYSRRNGLLFYCTGDNLRRGAAGNAVLIMKRMIEERYI